MSICCESFLTDGTSSMLLNETFGATKLKISVLRLQVFPKKMNTLTLFYKSNLRERGVSVLTALEFILLADASSQLFHADG